MSAPVARVEVAAATMVGVIRDVAGVESRESRIGCEQESNTMTTSRLMTHDS
jgi:hypothetical protein